MASAGRPSSHSRALRRLGSHLVTLQGASAGRGCTDGPESGGPCGCGGGHCWGPRPPARNCASADETVIPCLWGLVPLSLLQGVSLRPPASGLTGDACPCSPAPHRPGLPAWPEGQQGTWLSFLVSGCATREPAQPRRASSHPEWGCARAGHVGAWPGHPWGPCPLLAQDEGWTPCSPSSHRRPFLVIRLPHSVAGTGPRVAWLRGIQVGIMVSTVGGGLRSGSPKPGPGDSTVGLICQPPNFLAMGPSSRLGALVSTLVMWGQSGSFYLTRLGPSSKWEVLPAVGWGRHLLRGWAAVLRAVPCWGLTAVVSPVSPL